MKRLAVLVIATLAASCPAQADAALLALFNQSTRSDPVFAQEAQHAAAGLGLTLPEAAMSASAITCVMDRLQADLVAASSNSPITLRALSDPDFARIAHHAALYPECEVREAAQGRWIALLAALVPVMAAASYFIGRAVGVRSVRFASD
jgi:hypothetical protein